jgi:hypothetical protein
MGGGRPKSKRTSGVTASIGDPTRGGCFEEDLQQQQKRKKGKAAFVNTQMHGQRAYMSSSTEGTHRKYRERRNAMQRRGREQQRQKLRGGRWHVADRGFIRRTIQPMGHTRTHTHTHKANGHTRR